MNPLRTAIFAALALSFSTYAAHACAPPAPIWEIGEVWPPDGLVVPTNSAILMFPAADQEEGVERNTWDTDVEVMDSEGMPVEGRLEEWRDGLRWAPSEPLVPDADYAYEVRQSNERGNTVTDFDGTFRTGAGPAELPGRREFAAIDAARRVGLKTECAEWGGSCGDGSYCVEVREVEKFEQPEAGAEVDVDVGDWPAVVVALGVGATAEAASEASAEAENSMLHTGGEVSLTTRIGRLEDWDAPEICTAAALETPAGEQVLIGVHCAPKPASIPIEQDADEDSGCSSSGSPTSPLWLTALLLGLIRRR